MMTEKTEQEAVSYWDRFASSKMPQSQGQGAERRGVSVSYDRYGVPEPNNPFMSQAEREAILKKNKESAEKFVVEICEQLVKPEFLMKRDGYVDQLGTLIQAKRDVGYEAREAALSILREGIRGYQGMIEELTDRVASESIYESKYVDNVHLFDQMKQVENNILLLESFIGVLVRRTADEN